MVWPFKKRGDVIDLTYLAKRGLIKMPKLEEDEKNEPISTSGGDALSFLGSMAAASPSLKEESSGGVKNKIDDFEFKLDNLIRRVDQMFDRLDLVEKKVSRNERQG
jgi:hypothetical protein